MYASTKAMSKPDGGTVGLPFKHALNQVHFNAKTESKNLHVDIAENGIQLCNIKSAGTFTFPIVPDEPAANAGVGSWKDQKTAATFTATSGAAIINTTYATPETSVAVEVSTNDVLMLMPQTVEPWNLAGAASGQAGAYLKINCKLYTKVGDQDVYYHGSESTESADGYDFMYIPFPGKGMDGQGKKITYTLIFGGGFTDEGQPILTPITFDTTVTDWIDADNVDINTQPVTPPSAN